MRRYWILGILLAMSAVAYAVVGVKQSSTATLSIMPAGKTVTDTIPLYSGLNLQGVRGQVIVGVSSYTTGGFGGADTARVAMKSQMGDLVYTLDSGMCSALPCTLYFNAPTDSVFLQDLFLDIDWMDSIAVGAGDTATSTVSWIMKFILPN